MDKPIRVVIADDLAIYREGLKKLLAYIPDVQLAGEAQSPQEAIRLANIAQPDVIMFDLAWYGDKRIGVNTIEQIKRQAPRVAIIAMTAYVELSEEAIRKGADMAVSKAVFNDPDQLEDLLREAIRKVQLDHTRYTITEQLSEREVQTLQLMACGYSNEEIGNALHCSPVTIKRYTQNICDKLHVRNRAHAIARAYDLGILKLGSSFEHPALSY